MARIDKYDPKSGGTRAALAADTSKTTPGNPKGVGLDANGRVVVGLGVSGYIGLLVLTQDKKAGDVVDVMSDGDIVEFTGVAGTNYFIDAANNNVVAGTSTRTATAPATAGSKACGYTVEATRLVVRMSRTPA